MTIAAHIPGKHPEHSFYYWCFRGMAAHFPDHHFILITDAYLLSTKDLPPNCTPHLCSPTIKNGLLRYYWYHLKLPAVLERYQVNCLFVPGLYGSLNASVKQIMLIDEMPSPSGIAKNTLLKRYIHKASAIACTTSALEKKIARKYPIVAKRCLITEKGIHPLFIPHEDAEIETMKEHHTNGNAYFLLVITEKNKHEFRKVLKAYTIFKKWQRSSIEVVCILKTKTSTPPVQDFSSYKWKAHIHFIHQPTIQTAAALYAGCYAWFDIDGEGNLMEEAKCAMQSHVPVIAASTYPDVPLESYLKMEITEQSIAEKMMMIYKDEVLRNQAVANAHQFIAPFSWPNMYQQLFQLASGENR